MTTLAMTVAKAESHPNADALRVYQFALPNREDTLQVVANLENVYEVGDVVVVVLADATLKDNTNIKACKLRGVPSYGMALGKTEVEVGTDLTEQYELPVVQRRGVNVIKWTEIESLYNVRRGLKEMGKEDTHVTYLGKVKLHGSCAGIQLFTDGRIVPQSRTRVLDPEDDNMGFARWTVSMYDYFSQVRARANELGYDHVVIFGEWSGSGINKGVAISKIDRKILAVFAVQIGGLDTPAKLDINGTSIRKLFPEHDDVFVLPWLGDALMLDFSNKEQLERQAEKINQLVESVETRDPWVYDTFGVDGLGEGVVMYPLIDKKYLGKDGPIFVDKMEFSDLVFKAKGEKHKVVKSKKAAQIDPEVAAGVEDFVSLFVTEPRLEQFAQQVGISQKNTGEFLKRFCSDVQKESVAELEASGLEWKQVSKPVGTAARTWYLNECKKL